MRHSEQDAHDARRRAGSGYAPGWHPVLAAVEVDVGVWHMTAPNGRVYAIVRMLELGGERGYRAVTWAERSQDRRLIGYRRTLRAATEAAHRAYLDAHGPAGLQPIVRP